MFIEVTFSAEWSIYFLNKNVKFVLFYNLETSLNIKLYFQPSFDERAAADDRDENVDWLDPRIKKVPSVYILNFSGFRL